MRVSASNIWSPNAWRSDSQLTDRYWETLPGEDLKKASATPKSLLDGLVA
jgi:hypothetical protein